jgi:threonine/homoserine/homoserine lactone efflux protein
MLISHSSLLLFITGAAVLLVIPGPAVTYVVSRSIGHGRAAGLVSVLGIVVGTLCHVVAAALGISAVLASSVLAFQFVKYLGAGYLIYLGIKTLRTGDQQLLVAAGGETRLARIFGQGFLVNLLNPKTALFFLAFLPQFVDPARGHVTLQILQLGILFALMGWWSDSTVCVDCRHRGRADPRQLAPSPFPAQCLWWRLDRARTGLGIFRGTIEVGSGRALRPSRQVAAARSEPILLTAA